MSKQPHFILCICFVLGIVFQEKIGVQAGIPVYLILAATVLGSAAGFSRIIFFIRLRVYFVGAFFFLLGVILHFHNSVQPVLPNAEGKQEIVFKLNRKLNSNERNKRYEITVLSGHVFESILSVPRDEIELDYRHYYKAPALFNRVQAPNNDYQFDYSNYLKRKDIYFQAYLPDSYQTAERNDLTLSEKIKQLRLDVLQRIDKTTISSTSREFMKGIILADRTEMNKKTVSDFTKTGLVHILAISGSHMVVIFGIFFLIFKYAVPFSKRKTAIIGSLVFIWLFALLIDFGNPVVRSCIMLTVYHFYVLLNRKADMLHSMALAAFIILFLNTHQLFDVGFQLSFIAVFGIYWLNQPILKRLPKTKNNFQLFLASVVSITFAAQIATLPLVLYYFHQFSIISFVANLVIIPIAQIVIIFSMLMTAIIGTGFSVEWLNMLYDFFIQKVLLLISWFAGFENLLSKNIPFSAAEVVILFLSSYFLRFFILKVSFRSLLPLAYSLMAFFLLRFGLNIYYRNINEAIVHHHFKEKYFSAKEGDHVTFWISESASPDKTVQYVIDPYMVSRRARTYKVNTFPKGTTTIKYKGKTYNLQ